MKKVILFLLVICLFSCIGKVKENKTEVKNVTKIDPLNKNISVNEESSDFEYIIDTIIGNDKYSLVFDNSSGYDYLIISNKDSTIINNKDSNIFVKNIGKTNTIYFNKKIVIDRITSSLATKPCIELKLLDKNNLGIIILSEIIQMGWSTDGLNLYSYNFKNGKLKDLCGFDEIAVHDTEADTIEEAINYDYIIDEKNNKIVVKEYLPFKNPNNIKQKYKTKTRKCTYKLD